MTTGPPWVLNVPVVTITLPSLVTLTITLPPEIAAQLTQHPAEPVEARLPPGQAPSAEPSLCRWCGAAGTGTARSTATRAAGARHTGHRRTGT